MHFLSALLVQRKIEEVERIMRHFVFATSVRSGIATDLALRRRASRVLLDRRRDAGSVLIREEDAPMHEYERAGTIKHPTVANTPSFEMFNFHLSFSGSCFTRQ